MTGGKLKLLGDKAGKACNLWTKNLLGTDLTAGIAEAEKRGI